MGGGLWRTERRRHGRLSLLSWFSFEIFIHRNLPSISFLPCEDQPLGNPWHIPRVYRGLTQTICLVKRGYPDRPGVSHVVLTRLTALSKPFSVGFLPCSTANQNSSDRRLQNTGVCFHFDQDESMFFWRNNSHKLLRFPRKFSLLSASLHSDEVLPVRTHLLSITCRNVNQNDLFPKNSPNTTAVFPLKFLRALING